MTNQTQKYKIVRTKIFEKKLSKLDNSIRSIIAKKLLELYERPYDVGDPIRAKYIRELKVKSYRIYYLIQDKTVTVFLMNVSDKDNQQQIIEKVIGEAEQILNHL